MIYMTNCKVILTVLEYFLVELVVYKLITESLQSGDMPSRHEVIKEKMLSSFIMENVGSRVFGV